MNKNSMFAMAIVLSIPVFVFAQSAVKEQQRLKRYEVMNQTTEQMRQLVVSIQQYGQDNKGKMPPMQSPAALKRALQRYTRQDVFVSKSSGQPFVPNAKLSGKLLVQSNFIVWCYDSKPTLLNKPKDFYRVIGYWNHAIAMPERRWQSEKKNAGLP